MKSKNYILLVYFLLFCQVLTAQITFQKTYGGINEDYGHSVVQTPDNGYIICGSTKGFGPGDWYIYLIKTDLNGDTLWTKTFGGANQHIGYSMEITADGGFIIAGRTASFGFTNVYLIKTDSNGDLLWSNSFGETSHQSGRSVQQTSDGGYIIVGTKNGIVPNYNDVYLIKSDSIGNLLWSKSYGGVDYDYGNFVQQTSDGGFIICGSTGNDVYLIKTNTVGDTIWTKSFGDVNSNDQGYCVRQTMDGGYIIVGSTSIFNVSGYDDVYLIKVDGFGNFLWSKMYGSMYVDHGYSVQQTLDGGYIISGSVPTVNLSDVFLIKTDSNGDSLWTRNLGTTRYDSGNSVHQTNDGGYIICGSSYEVNNGISEIYLIKTDSLGFTGCNEGIVNIFEATPATQLANPTTIVTSPVTITTTPATLVGSGGVVTTLCTNVGFIELKNENLFSISPNPSNGSFVLNYKIPTNDYGIMKLYNTLGEEVYYMPLAVGSITHHITLPGYIANGIYICKISSKGWSDFVKVLVVR